MVRVLICDDQEVVRKGLEIILRHSDGVEVVALAENGAEAVRLAFLHEPDVVLMDLKMPVVNGIQATRQITTARPQTKIIVLTTYDDDDWVFDALRAGASGYLLKDTDGEEIAAAIRGVTQGEVRLDPKVAGKIVQAFNRLPGGRGRNTTPDTPTFEPLTDREISILRLMAQGQTNQEIADTLFLAAGTVKNNVSNIIAKLHTNDRTQAVLAALRHGLVDLT